MTDTAWIKARLADEFGLSEDDLARLYGLNRDDLDAHLAALEDGQSSTIVNRLISDVDAVRVGYRTVQVSDAQIEASRALLINYRFYPLIALDAAGHQHAWRLSGDDAQWIAFRISDVIGLDFEASDVLRLRLNRVAVGYGDNSPTLDGAFRDRIADIAFFLAELSGVL